jgi:deoxyribose-phosphate aldolase
MGNPAWKKAARLIDISAVRSHNTEDDVRETVRIAKEYGFINVHSLPCFTSLVSSLLADEPDIYTGAPVGFPGGGHTAEAKICEARRLISDGVEEMDIVMNIGKFRSGADAETLGELNQIIALAPPHVKTKVIIEINILSDEEMLRACRLVMNTGADFVKTGTGWIPGGANVERIEKILQVTAGNIKVKAAGGIRTKEEFERLRDLGVDRFGINLKSALEIADASL